MTQPEVTAHEGSHDVHGEVYSKTVFGFWIYLLSDFMLFATIFAAYAVLSKNTFGGPTARDLFDLPFTMVQTVILLVSTFTVGLAGAFTHRRNKNATIALFLITLILGLGFTWMETTELSRLSAAGHTWQGSAFLSMFFTLIGTHVLHMFFALLWVIILIIPVCRKGITDVSLKRLTCLRMFWQFLNIVWVFIFTFVYLLGVIE